MLDVCVTIGTTPNRHIVTDCIINVVLHYRYVVFMVQMQLISECFRVLGQFDKE